MATSKQSEIKYPPYVNAYGNVPKLFNKIKEAAVPPKFNRDFMSTMLDLKSSSYQAMIPLLKHLAFIDQANVPTQLYRDYREGSPMSEELLGNQIRNAYKELFIANTYANKLDKKALKTKLLSITGASSDDRNIDAVVGTFTELVKISHFTNGSEPAVPKPADQPEPKKRTLMPEDDQKEELLPPKRVIGANLGISYTINLNLPPTTEVEVFNAIFKSLRQNILDNE